MCDVLCSLDTFLMALPMYLLVGLAVHMFTRFPSPQIGKVSIYTEKRRERETKTESAPMQFVTEQSISWVTQSNKVPVEPLLRVSLDVRYLLQQTSGCPYCTFGRQLGVAYMYIRNLLAPICQVERAPSFVMTLLMQHFSNVQYKMCVSGIMILSRL
jgi:hypothetical protein